MLPLLDVQFEGCRCKVIPLKYGYFVRAAQLICLVSYRSMFLHEISGILWLTLWRCWLHSCRMFILLVEYGLVHRGDCINCETCYLCFDPAFVWPSLGRESSLYLACKPFPGLSACTRTGRWCASVVAIRSLSLFTDWADRRSHINSLDSWCATYVSKTMMMMSWCLMSSDVSWHIRDKLWPMLKHGSISLYVHGNPRAR